MNDHDIISTVHFHNCDAPSNVDNLYASKISPESNINDLWREIGFFPLLSYRKDGKEEDSSFPLNEKGTSKMQWDLSGSFSKHLFVPIFIIPQNIMSATNNVQVRSTSESNSHCTILATARLPHNSISRSIKAATVTQLIRTEHVNASKFEKKKKLYGDSTMISKKGNVIFTSEENDKIAEKDSKKRARRLQTHKKNKMKASS